jgi:predicted peroxiredoxin
MKNLFFILLSSLLLFSCIQNNVPENSAAATQAETVKDGIFIHISHGPEDPHRVLMALRMAEIMAADKDVLVYFDVKAVNVVLKGSDNITINDLPSSHEQLQKLIDMGVEMQVCPGCLKVAGKSIEDVIDGVVLADKERFFSFTEGRILSIDY